MAVVMLRCHEEELWRGRQWPGRRILYEYQCHPFLKSANNLSFLAAKSKKQRRLAAKRQKEREAKLLAEGNVEALAPKIPIQHQSINLPGEEGGSVEDNIASAAAREELKKAMRKERKAKIKEANYLKSF